MSRNSVLIKTLESRSKEENTVDMMVQAYSEMNCGGVVSDTLKEMDFNQLALDLKEDLPSDSWILELLVKMEAMMEKSRAQPPKNLSPLRVVMLGKTGSGKSASANTILGRNVFQEEFSFDSVTKTCIHQHMEIDGRQIQVIDTPGLFDTKMDMKELKVELEKCVEMSLPGPHAFLLVMRLDVRYTEEEKNVVKLIWENFGEGALKYTIVLLTHGDVLEGKPVEDFLLKHPAFLSLTKRFGGGYHVFNNKSKNSTQVRELKEKIEAMVEENGGANYTNEMYKEAQRKIIEKKRKREEVERKKKQERERELKEAKIMALVEKKKRLTAEGKYAEERWQQFEEMEKVEVKRSQQFEENVNNEEENRGRSEAQEDAAEKESQRCGKKEKGYMERYNTWSNLGKMVVGVATVVTGVGVFAGVTALGAIAVTLVADGIAVGATAAAVTAVAEGVAVGAAVVEVVGVGLGVAGFAGEAAAKAVAANAKTHAATAAKAAAAAKEEARTAAAEAAAAKEKGEAAAAAAAAAKEKGKAAAEKAKAAKAKAAKANTEANQAAAAAAEIAAAASAATAAEEAKEAEIAAAAAAEIAEAAAEKEAKAAAAAEKEAKAAAAAAEEEAKAAAAAAGKEEEEQQQEEK